MGGHITVNNNNNNNNNNNKCALVEVPFDLVQVLHVGGHTVEAFFRHFALEHSVSCA